MLFALWVSLPGMLVFSGNLFDLCVDSAASLEVLWVWVSVFGFSGSPGFPRIGIIE